MRFDKKPGEMVLGVAAGVLPTSVLDVEGDLELVERLFAQASASARA